MGNRFTKDPNLPLSWQFNTANFTEGRHTFSAIGYKSDGTELHAPEFTRVFLSADQAWSETGDMIVPILVLVGIATFAGVLGPVLLRAKESPYPRGLWDGRWGRLPPLHFPLFPKRVGAKYVGWEIGALPTLRQMGHCSPRISRCPTNC